MGSWEGPPRQGRRLLVWHLYSWGWEVLISSKGKIATQVGLWEVQEEVGCRLLCGSVRGAERHSCAGNTLLCGAYPAGGSLIRPRWQHLVLS